MSSEPASTSVLKRLPAYTQPVRETRLFAWTPGLDTWIALASVLGMWLLHLIEHWLAPTHPTVGESILLFAGAVLLAFLLPTWIVWHRMRRDLDDLGLQLRRTWLAAAISAVVVLVALPGFWLAAGSVGVDPMSQLIGQLLGVWEPFFLFAWVLLRMRDAFGEIAAPVIAALAYGFYHLGTEALADSLFRVGLALLPAIAFAVTRSLLAVLPFTWAMVTGLVSMARGIEYTVDQTALAVVLLIIQVGIVIFSYRRHPGDLVKDRGSNAPDDRGASEIRARASREKYRRRS